MKSNSGATRSNKGKRKRRSLKQINPNAAGIDCGATAHYVAVPVDCDDEPVRRFSSFTTDLHRMAQWLETCGIETVAMEATGVYWIAVYEILEARGFEVLLVNARHVKHVPGRKSDVLDCQWLQELRQVCSERGIVMIMDEVFLGFRLARGGAQQYFGVHADMVTYGKGLGGGLPVGVLCGKHELMKRFRDHRPTDISFARGTFNSHPYVMTSMNVFLQRIDENDIQQVYQHADHVWEQRINQINNRQGNNHPADDEFDFFISCFIVNFYGRNCG